MSKSQFKIVNVHELFKKAAIAEHLENWEEAAKWWRKCAQHTMSEKKRRTANNRAAWAELKHFAIKRLDTLPAVRSDDKA